MGIRASRRWPVVVPIVLLAVGFASAVWWSRRDTGDTVVTISNRTTDARITVTVEEARNRAPVPPGTLGPVEPQREVSGRFERPEGPIVLVVGIESRALSEGEPVEVTRSHLPPISSLDIRALESETPEGRSIRVEGSFRLASEGRRDLGDWLSGRAFGRRHLAPATYTLDREGDAPRVGAASK